MKRSDLCVVGVIYAVSLAFFIMTVELPEEAQTYPMGLIIALAGLNTFYLIQCLMKAWKAGRFSVANDLPEVFNGFQPLQFFFVAGGCALFLFLMYTVGYYIAGAVYLVGTLLFFKVNLRWIALTLVTLVALIYAVFTLFLKVPLPTGVLFG